MRKVAISFWPGGPSISEQLTTQNFPFDVEIVKGFDNRKNFMEKAFGCAEITHEEAFETARCLAEEINTHIQTYVPPVVEEPIAEPEVIKPIKVKKVGKKKSAKTVKKNKKAVKK